jgi:hypothetical protein
VRAELDELLVGALDAALTKYTINQFLVMMSDPTQVGLDRFMLGLTQAVVMYTHLRPLILAIDDPEEA